MSLKISRLHTFITVTLLIHVYKYVGKRSRQTELGFVVSKQVKVSKDPPAPKLSAVKIEQLIAVNLNHIGFIFLENMKCFSGEHKYQIVQKNTNQITSFCGCCKSTTLKSTSNIFYKDFLNPVLFASKETRLTFLDNSKQMCGYIPKVKFEDTCIKISCGHHSTCSLLIITILGTINLI